MSENDLPPPPPSKTLPMLLVGNSVLLAAILAVVLLRGSGSEAKEPATGEAAASHEGGGETPHPGGLGPTAKLPDFVIRLRDPEVDRYVRFTFEIELGREEDREVVTGAMPRIRDSLIAYLSDRTLPELRGSEGLAKLKAGLATVLDADVPGHRIKNVYVTDFVVQ